MSFSKKFGKSVKRLRSSLDDETKQQNESIWETKQNECEQIRKDSNEIPTLEEMEHRALAERIMNIMKITYERLQVALIIPQILAEEKNVFSMLVSEQQRNEIFEICENYLDNYNDEDRIVMVDHELIKAVDLIHNNQQLMDHFSRHVHCLPSNSKKFLKAINDLRTLTASRIKTSAKTELKREKILHQICHENEKMELKIEALKSQLRERDLSMQWKIAEKQALIQKYKKDLSTKKWDNQILVKKEVASANARMAQIYNKSEERQQELREQASKSKQAYEKLLQDNLRADKKLREKKARILTQLKGWIKKYDNDIGERTREVDRLEMELDEKTAEYNEFMKLYTKQEEEYNAIVAKREAEEKVIQEEKMLLFMMNRAARIIQGKWREYNQKRKKKTKSKGKKGKK